MQDAGVGQEPYGLGGASGGEAIWRETRGVMADWLTRLSFVGSAMGKNK